MTWTLEIDGKQFILTDREGTLLETQLATAGRGMPIAFTRESTGEVIQLRDDAAISLTRD